MAGFRIDSLAELARQMNFAPRDTRLAQTSAAEDLLHDLDPAKAYPYDFIIHRITGYRPKVYSETLLTGLALQHDLGLLIETVSEGLDVQTSAIAEPVLAISDVTERFNVTSKTIQRWRRRGLPARRFIFPDGKRRVGFLLSSVERFLVNQHEPEDHAANLSQIDDAEHVHIVSMARRLAVGCKCSPHEIARRIAHRLNRSPLTIQHTLRKHDSQHPADAILPLAAPELTDDERSHILKGNRRGRTPRELARRVGRSRSAVYRVLLDERLAKLNRRKVKFIDDALYHQDEAGSMVDAMVKQEELLAESPEESRMPRDLPPYLQELYRTRLLSASRERALFLKFNYHKFEFVTARRQIEPQFSKLRDITLLERLLRQATAVKDQILRANLRLVVSVARKHLRPGLSLMELISEGNLTLMRAAESFDVHRGYRFSTYATLALMKGFARAVPQLTAAHKGCVDNCALAQVADNRLADAFDRSADREHVRHLLSQLSDRERRVLLSYYGLDGNEAATFEQVGQRLGMSRQQVRLVEQSAMAKLRRAAGLPTV